MPFNSLNYLIFLPIIWIVYQLASDRVRWFVLLSASLLFYAALKEPHLMLALPLVSGLTYGAGLWLHRAGTPMRKRALLWGGIAANLLVLIVMKYLPFLTENLSTLASLISAEARIRPMSPIITIGVSYYVFQAISYLLDIYLEIEEPEQHFGYFALYLAFFPKLLQGPIERARDLLPQLKRTYVFDYDQVRSGLALFLWGLFKKLVIADRLGLFANTVYDDVHAFHGLPLILATYFYAFQIYMDFSAYTDMALGSASLFNIKLTRNFDSPYLATSMADFWRRWHITFSRWILDYIFKPLQMHWRDRRSWGTVAALMVTFLVSGIWHGASWGFMIWGGLHGLYLACSVFYKPHQKKLHRFLRIEKSSFLKAAQVFITFHLVCFAWIFFRASSLADAWYVITHIPQLRVTEASPVALKGMLAHNLFLHQSSREFAVAMLCLGLTATLSWLMHRSGNGDLLRHLDRKPTVLRWSVYYALVFSIIAFAVYESGTFIYYKF